jgi:hypothetical protein
MFSRLPRKLHSARTLARIHAQPFSLSAIRWKNLDTATDLPEAQDVPQQLLGSREEIARKRREAEEKYAEKIKRRMEE